MTDKWYISGPLGIGEPEPTAPLVVSGEISLMSPDSGIHSLRFKRTDEEHRVHEWALWHMNQDNRRNALEIWEYRTDSTGKSCGGNPADGAMCAPRLVILEGGNVGVGTATPSAGLEIDKGITNDVALVLNSSGPGWGSGMKLINKGAPGGKNYGIYSGSGRLNFTDIDIGADRLVVAASGNIGIGTIEPNASLEIYKDNTNDTALLLNTTGDGWGAGIQFLNRSARSKPYGLYAGKDGRFHFSDENAHVDRLIIDQTGWLTVDAGGSAGIKTRHLEGKHYQNETDDALYLNWRSGKDVHIGEATRPSNLLVNGDLTLGRHKKIYSEGRLHIGGAENLYLLNKGGVIVGREWEGTGKLVVEGDLEVQGTFITHKRIDNSEANAILDGLPAGSAIMAVEPSTQGSAMVWYWKDDHGKKLKGWMQGANL